MVQRNISPDYATKYQWLACAVIEAAGGMSQAEDIIRMSQTYLTGAALTKEKAQTEKVKRQTYLTEMLQSGFASANDMSESGFLGQTHAASEKISQVLEIPPPKGLAVKSVLRGTYIHRLLCIGHILDQLEFDVKFGGKELMETFKQLRDAFYQAVDATGLGADVEREVEIFKAAAPREKTPPKIPLR